MTKHEKLVKKEMQRRSQLDCKENKSDKSCKQ